MANDVTANPGAGGAVFATDEISGVHYPRTKITLGEEDVNGGDVSSSNPMPVRLDAASLAALESITIGTALPAGTANIGDVDVASIAAGDNNIGNVDIVTVPTDPFGANADAASASGSISAKLRQIATNGIPITGTVTVGSHAVTNAGTFATQVDGAALTALQLIDNIVATEDAVAGTGYSGVPILAVRQDSQTGLAADGDFISPTIDSAGGLRVSIVAGAGSGGTAAADDADFTAGTTSGTPIMGIYETTPTTVTAGDLGVVRINANRQIEIAPGVADVTIGSTVGVRVFLFDGSNNQITSFGGGTQYTEDGASAGGESLTLAGAIRRDTAASSAATDGDYATLNVDSTGRLWCNVSNTVTISGTVTANAGSGTLAVSLASVPSHAVTNAGTFAVQVDGNALTALQLIDNTIFADDAAFTVGSSSVNVAGYIADETATDSVDEGDAGAARMTLDRKQVVAPYPHTAGGLATFMASGSDGYSVLSAAAQAVKATAGQIYGYYIYNPNATAHFVHFYDVAAGSVTVGTTVPLFTLTIPATSAANLMGTMGIAFGTAISCSATSAAGTNGSPAVGLDAVVWYK